MIKLDQKGDPKRDPKGDSKGDPKGIQRGSKGDPKGDPKEDPNSLRKKKCWMGKYFLCSTYDFGGVNNRDMSLFETCFYW